MVSRLNPAAHPAKTYSSQPRFSGKTEEDNQPKQAQSPNKSSSAEGVSSAEAPPVKSESSTQDTKPQAKANAQEKPPGFLKSMWKSITQKLAEWGQALQNILNAVLQHLNDAAEEAAKQQTEKNDSTATNPKTKTSAPSNKTESSQKKAPTESRQTESNPTVEEPDSEAETASPKAASGSFIRTTSAQNLNPEAEEINLDQLLSMGFQILQSLFAQNNETLSSQAHTQAPIEEDELPPSSVTIEELDENDNPIPGTKVVHPTGTQSPTKSKDKKAS